MALALSRLNYNLSFLFSPLPVGGEKRKMYFSVTSKPEILCIRIKIRRASSDAITHRCFPECWFTLGRWVPFGLCTFPGDCIGSQGGGYLPALSHGAAWKGLRASTPGAGVHTESPS